MQQQVSGSAGAVGLGYQGQDIDGFVAAVVGAGIDVVVDVRLTPLSRKRGFAKRALAEALAAAGVDYEHLPALGNPKANRPGFTGTPEEFREARARYAALLDSPDAVAALDHLADLAARERVGVLCFEADESRCHRDLVLAVLRRRLGG